MSEAGLEPAPRYMPQLDTLRVFAVGAVLVHHFMDLDALPGFLGKINWGVLGVRLFFVLSGFLITGILLRARRLSEAAGGSRRFALKQFYARRFLRIFPLYYLVIGVALALNVGPVRDIAGWLLTYTSNLYMSWTGEWIHAFSHFWSLAVEEQFYLLWPLVILFAPRRVIAPAALTLVATGVLYRLWAVTHGVNAIALRCFTLGAVDTLGCGALLAIATISGTGDAALRRWLDRAVLPAGLVAFAISEYCVISGRYYTAGVVTLDCAASVVFAWLVYRAAKGFRGPAGALLAAKPLVFVGRITYGIYVYHFFLPVIYGHVFPLFGRVPPAKGPVNLLVSSVLAVGIASASWLAFERPINALKRRFDYERTTSATDFTEHERRSCYHRPAFLPENPCDTSSV